MNYDLTVIGGVYRERCRLPDNYNETWGSGGRAAAVAAGLGLRTLLVTATDASTDVMAATLAASFNFQLSESNAPAIPKFDYQHGLATPVISPVPGSINRIQIEAEAVNALLFGMLEADVKLDAERLVYDPQNPLAPQALPASVTVSGDVAYVLNSSEANALSGEHDHKKAARKVIEEFGASVVVIKRGAWGAYVLDEHGEQDIPAYLTQNIWPIGSGDVFAAVFAARWASQRMSAVEAAHHASRGAALYVNDRVLPLSADTLTLSPRDFPFKPRPLNVRRLEDGEYHIYLAGPFFSIAHRWLVEEARRSFLNMGIRVFSPLHDVGIGAGGDVAPKDIDALRASRVVFALIDGLDAGTLFEVGYARCLNKPVIALVECTPEEPLKMVAGTGCEIVPDFITAIYRSAWIAQA